MVELVDLAWGRQIHLGLDLNEKPMKGNGVHDQPTPIVKLPKACEYAQLLSNFVLEHHSEIAIEDVTNMQSFMYKLNEMLISNANEHHQRQ